MLELRRKLSLQTAGLVLSPLHQAASWEAFGSSLSVSNLLLKMAMLLLALVIPDQREEITVTVKTTSSKEALVELSIEEKVPYPQHLKTPVRAPIIFTNMQFLSKLFGVRDLLCLLWERHPPSLTGPSGICTQISQKPILFRWSPSMYISQDGFRQPTSILSFL